ncbi:MAG: hypothetical protein ACTSVV_03515, partial [Promethearchaeota archaeon]
NDYSQFNKIDVIHYLLNKYSIERSLNLSRYIQDILDSIKYFKDINYNSNNNGNNQLNSRISSFSDTIKKGGKAEEDFLILQQLQSMHSVNESVLTYQWMLYLIVDFFDSIGFIKNKITENNLDQKTPEILNASGILFNIKIAQNRKLIFSKEELQRIQTLKSDKYSPLMIDIPEFPYILSDPYIQKESIIKFFESLINSKSKLVIGPNTINFDILNNDRVNDFIKSNNEIKDYYFNSLLFKNTEFDDIYSQNPEISDKVTKFSLLLSIPLEFALGLIKFYQSELKDFLPEPLKSRFKIINNIFSTLLNHYYPTSFVMEDFDSFMEKCQKWSISKKHLSTYILEPNSKREEFTKFYKILEHPILMADFEGEGSIDKTDKTDKKVIISWILLFDAYLYNIAKLIKSNKIKRKRGILFELYISDKIQEILGKQPFKLILINSKKIDSDKIYPIVKKELVPFKEKYPIYEIDVSSAVLNTDKFRFQEFDVCFIYDNILFSLECKNKLYFKLSESEHAIIKEFLDIYEKIERKKAILLRPEVIRIFHDKTNLIYQKVKNRIITPIKINLKGATTIRDFTDYLEKIRDVL